MLAAKSAKIDFWGPTAHALHLALVQFWPLWLLIGLVGLGKAFLWLLEQRRISRSGIEEIDHMDGHTFERRMQVLFRDLGYRVQRTGKCGDYGADLVVELDGDKTVVQAKRWTKTVGVKAVQEAVAAKPMYGCDQALVVTNSHFSKEARRLAEANKVALWDRDRLIRQLLTTE